ncbi:MAG TPA: DMT family transporter [Vicinamibacterales bacterium]|nr:DMT family transporter [Vicinamibacterales bacterium]
MTRIDALLVVMVLIWGANFSVLKLAFAEMPPQSFNSLRILIASAVFLAVIGWAHRQAARGRRVSRALFTPDALNRRDWIDLVWLGVVGHCFYQLGFAGGVNLTSVANAALLMGATPVAVALVSLALGRERLGALHWAGVSLSVAGIYIVVGRGASFGGSTLRGDLLVLASVLCWSAYTIGAMRLIARHSPLYVTGITMTIGAVPYVLIAIPQMRDTNWAAVSAWTWGALVWSALFALCASYLIWYIAVQRIGPSRTAIYSNVVPIAALGVAALWLRKPVTATKIAGAAAILGGVFLTRIGRKPSGVPIEE